MKLLGYAAVAALLLLAVNQDDDPEIDVQPESIAAPYAVPPPSSLEALPYDSEDAALTFDDYSGSDEYPDPNIEPPLDFSGVNSAVDDLNSSVRRLRMGEDWDYGLPQVDRRLRDLDREIFDLEMQDMSNPDVMNLRFEADRMRREMRRLESGNWRDVVPDIERRNRSLGFEAGNLDDWNY